MNWIIEGQLLAFSGPHNTVEIIDGVRTLQPEDYLPLFQHLHIGVVIRLNRATYDASRFTNHGIQHYDIFFPDGGLPQCIILYYSFNTIVQQILQFIYIMQTSTTGVAVHCKAGLGRTGTMICAYLMYQYSFTCEEAIGYCRLCRSGSVVGCQQEFLKVDSIIFI